MNSKVLFCTWWLFVWFFCIFPSLFQNLSSTSNSMHDPFCTFPSTTHNPQIQELIDIHFNVSSSYEDHDINSLQTYIQKMSINVNSRGLWGDNRAIFCLENYLHRPIHVWSKNNFVMCFWANDDFISNNTLQLLYHDDMVNAKNGHYEPITFYNTSWEVD